jgi:hypothetical protein
MLCIVLRKGHVVAWEVSYEPLAQGPEFSSRQLYKGFFYGFSGTGRKFSGELRFLPCQCHCTSAPCLFTNLTTMLYDVRN